MAVKMLRIFPINGWAQNGFPTVGTPVKPLTPGSGEKEINLSAIHITHTVSETELFADDQSESSEAVTGYDFSAEIYGADPAFIVALGLATLDANGNLVHKTTNNTHVAVYLSGANQKGKKYNLWLYDVVAKPIDRDLTTDKGEVADPITINFVGKPVATTDFGNVVKCQVFEGNSGYISGITEPTALSFYTPTAPSN